MGLEEVPAFRAHFCREGGPTFSHVGGLCCPSHINMAAPRKRSYPFEECIPLQSKIHVGAKEVADEDEMERVYGKDGFFV